VENYAQKHASGVYTESLQQTILHSENKIFSTTSGKQQIHGGTTIAKVNNVGYYNFCQLQQWHPRTPVLFVGVPEKHMER